MSKLSNSIGYFTKCRIHKNKDSYQDFCEDFSVKVFLLFFSVKVIYYKQLKDIQTKVGLTNQNSVTFKWDASHLHEWELRCTEKWIELNTRLFFNEKYRQHY